MRHGVDADVGADEDVVADGYGRLVEDRQVEIAREIVPDRNLRPEVAMERAVDAERAARAAEQLPDDRVALLFTAGRQAVEPEDQFFAALQCFPDLRLAGMEPQAGFHLFEIVHSRIVCVGSVRCPTGGCGLFRVPALPAIKKHTVSGVLFLRISPRRLSFDDSLARAYAGAGTAVDALVGVDDIDIAGRDSLRRAFADATAAGNARISDFVSHFVKNLLLRCVLCSANIETYFIISKPV